MALSSTQVFGRVASPYLGLRVGAIVKPVRSPSARGEAGWPKPLTVGFHNPDDPYIDTSPRGEAVPVRRSSDEGGSSGEQGEGIPV